MPRLQGQYVTTVDVPLADGTTRQLNVWQNPETGNLVGLENMALPCDVNHVQDPYDPHVQLVFADTFSGLPK